MLLSRLHIQERLYDGFRIAGPPRAPAMEELAGQELATGRASHGAPEGDVSWLGELAENGRPNVEIYCYACTASYCEEFEYSYIDDKLDLALCGTSLIGCGDWPSYGTGSISKGGYSSGR